jgi:hypothetical protein
LIDKNYLLNKLKIFIFHFKKVKFNKGVKSIHLKILTVSTIFFNDIDGFRKPSKVIKKMATFYFSFLKIYILVIAFYFIFYGKRDYIRINKLAVSRWANIREVTLFLKLCRERFV